MTRHGRLCTPFAMLLCATCSSKPTPSAEAPTRYAALASPHQSPARRDSDAGSADSTNEDTSVEQAPRATKPITTAQTNRLQECSRLFPASPVGRTPRYPSKNCAAPAMDPHTSDRDTAAMTKMTEALNVYYLNGMWENQLLILFGVSDACQTHCSPQVQAKAWMYAGLLYGAALQDLEACQCAFETAILWDPAVVLDAQLATPAAKKAFEGAHRAICGSDSAP